MAGALLATTGRHAPSAPARSWVQATTAQTARQALSALRGIGRHQIDADDPVVHRAEGDRGELPACRAQGGEHRGGRATPGSGAACAARPLGSRCSGMRVEPFLARPALSNLGICTIGNAASEIHRDRAGLGLNRPLPPARRARHLARDGRSRRRGRWRRPCDLVGERRAPGRIGLTEFARRVWPSDNARAPDVEQQFAERRPSVEAGLLDPSPELRRHSELRPGRFVRREAGRAGGEDLLGRCLAERFQA